MRATRAIGGLITCMLGAAAASAQTYDIDWFTIDGGGGTSTGGGFSLSGTIGQPDAGVMSGGNFVLVGGFWGATPAASGCPGLRGDADCNGTVDFFDIDPFLLALFNQANYLSTFCGGSLCAADASCDGTVDFFDIDPFLNCLFGGCTPCP